MDLVWVLWVACPVLCRCQVVLVALVAQVVLEPELLEPPVPAQVRVQVVQAALEACQAVWAALEEWEA